MENEKEKAPQKRGETEAADKPLRKFPHMTTERRIKTLQRLIELDRKTNQLSEETSTP